MPRLAVTPEEIELGVSPERLTANDIIRGRKRQDPRPHTSQSHRDAEALVRCEELLDKQALGKKRLSNATLTAIKIRYDKLRPALSSVEQTVHQDGDELTKEQIMAKFQQLIDAYPDFLQELLALQAKRKPVELHDAEQQSEQKTGTE